jgi:tRNA wybutosine-synthesizing protein 3
VNFNPNMDGSITPMVGVRSTGLALETIIGYYDEMEEAKSILVVDEIYLRVLCDVANERFRMNEERIQKFQAKLLNVYAVNNTSNDAPNDWEDSKTRGQRKRAEGLERQRVRASTVESSHDSAEQEGYNLGALALQD